MEISGVKLHHCHLQEVPFREFYLFFPGPGGRNQDFKAKMIYKIIHNMQEGL